MSTNGSEPVARGDSARNHTGRRVVAGSLRAPLVCIAFLVACYCVLLGQSLFSSKGLVATGSLARFDPWQQSLGSAPENPQLFDQYMSLLPQRHIAHEEWQQGRVPLWNPYIMCGVPMLASMQAALLYPLHLAAAWSDPFEAAEILALIKLLIAGLGMLMYSRRLGTTWGGGTVAALTYSLCAFMIVWLGHPHVNGAILAPWLLLASEAALARAADVERTWRNALPWASLALLYACLWLGGHVGTAVHLTVLTTAYFVYRLVQSDLPHRRWSRLACAYAICIVAGVLLAAPQLLPFVEYYAHSSSPASSAALERWSAHLPLRALLYYFLPGLTGSPAQGGEVALPMLGLPVVNFNERALFVGIVPLYLFVLGLTKARPRWIRVFGAIYALSLLVILGVPPLPALIKHLPILGNINHTRLILVLSLSIAVLAARGLDYIIASREAPGLVDGAFLVILAAIFLFVRLRVGAGMIDWRVWIPFFVATLVIGLIRWIPPGPHGWLRCGVLLCATAFELLSFGQGVNPATPRSHYYATTETHRWLETHMSSDRLIALGPVLPANTGMVHRLRDVRGLDFMTPRRYEELIRGSSGEFWFYSSTTVLPAKFGWLAARYVLTPASASAYGEGFSQVVRAPVAIYEHAKALPRAFAAFEHETLPDARHVLERMRESPTTARSVVLLEEQFDGGSAASDSFEPSTGDPSPTPPVTFVQDDPGRVVLSSRMPSPGWIVLLDTHFPGWTATVNGSKARIYRAYYDFRAVPVPAGPVEVVLVYRPLSFWGGLALSVATLAVLCAFVFWSRRPGARGPGGMLR